MADRKHVASMTPTPDVEDPHPGSVSDGTHPAAAERKPPRSGESPGEERQVKSSPQALTERKTRINTEAPRHPTKSASAS